MIEDEPTLSGLQLADSLLPVGNDSNSYALEQFVQAERVEDAADLQALLESYLHGQVGPAELVALRAAHTAVRAEDVDALVAADRHLHASTLPKEFRTSATRSGERLCELWREIRDVPILDRYSERSTPAQYPVVLGAVTASEAIGQRRACMLHAHSFLSDMLGAAQRLLRLGATEAQQIRSDVQPAVSEAVADSADRTLEEMAPFAPLIELQSTHHERAQRRLFMS